jgi:hypothetical protein
VPEKRKERGPSRALPREARQSLMRVSTEGSLTNELAENRRAIDRLDRQLRAEVAHSAPSLDQDQQWVALARESIAARQEVPPARLEGSSSA